MGIRAVVPAPDWSAAHHRGEAKCRNSSLFPHRDRDVFFDDESLALAICNGTYDNQVCPRRTECLRVAMHNRENFGVWGGMTATDRLEMRMRYPGMPERWIWQAPREPEARITEETPWPVAS
ncbi:WhiB family transcriptional regulator [Streptomyces albus]|uniref:WhiB family transcriptional regulator n=1 Tax=Streptomyces albus TaxID=1888 RepID=UPI0036FEE3E5